MGDELKVQNVYVNKLYRR